MYCTSELGDDLLFDVCCLFVDVDECQTDEHNCNQTCSNTLGSFECKCRLGYSLQRDNATCRGTYVRMYVCMYAITLLYAVYMV